MKKNKPKIIIMSGYGLNCEEETRFAFKKAGGEADIVHINDLIAKPKLLEKYHILAFPGGFSYGDDTGSGKAYANKFKNHLSKELERFLSRDTLVIGICNGFQIITNLGILPGALTYNSGGKYLDRWVDLQVPTSAKASARQRSPWLFNINKISIPIAHGEGRYVIDEKEYKVLKKNKQIAFTYVKGEMCGFQNLKPNPNGSMHDIAGVLAYNGRVLGLMPHPERGMFFHQRPDYYVQKETYKRKGNPHQDGAKDLPKEGLGFQIFKNAINYFSA